MGYFYITVFIPWSNWRHIDFIRKLTKVRCSEKNKTIPTIFQPFFALPRMHTLTYDAHLFIRPSLHCSIPTSLPLSIAPTSLILLSFLQQTWPRSQTARPCRYRTTYRRCARAVLGWARRAAAILCWTAVGHSALSSCFSRMGPPTCGWPPTITCGGTTAGLPLRSSSWSYRLWWCRCWASAGSRMTTWSRAAPVPPRQPWWQHPVLRGAPAPRRAASGPAAAEPAPGFFTASCTSSS